MLITFMITSWIMLGPWFQGTKDINVPEDITIWQGLSLALIFNILVGFLRAINVIQPGPLKKSIGYILMGLGAVVGGAFAIGSAKVDDFVPLVQYIAGGALSGVMAVGNASTVKNGRQAWPYIMASLSKLFKNKAK